MRYGIISTLFILLWISLFLMGSKYIHKSWGDYIIGVMLFSPPIGVLFGIMGITSDKKKWLSILSTFVNVLATLMIFILPRLSK
jgi:hypothetical protein